MEGSDEERHPPPLAKRLFALGMRSERVDQRGQAAS